MTKKGSKRSQAGYIRPNATSFRIPPDLKKRAKLSAELSNKTFKVWIGEAIKEKMDREKVLEHFQEILESERQ